MIKIQNVKKRYEKNSFRMEIDNLELMNNRIYAILGKNGAGKSTMIRLILGLLEADEGTIWYNDKTIKDSPGIKKLIGYVPDEPILYETLTGKEQIQFTEYLYGVENEKLIQELLEEFDIINKADEYIYKYSKGMKQKISIISAIVHEPDIMILDEPFVGLDPTVIIKLKKWLKNYVKKENKMVLFSTHDLDVANDLCTDAIYVKEGQVIAELNKEDIEKANSNFTDKFCDYIMDGN